MKTINTIKTLLILLLCSCGNNSMRQSIDAIENEKELKPIDLGLSVNWANINVGAEHVADFGGYYAITKDTSCIIVETVIDDYGIYRKNPSWVDSINVVDIEYDVANQYLGKKWRLPTIDEMEELIYKCEWTWGILGSTEGVYITGPNGNKIFLPAAGDKEAKYGDEPFGNYRCSYVWDDGASFIITFNKPQKGIKLTPESSYFSNEVGSNIYFCSFSAQVPFSVRAVKSK